LVHLSIARWFNSIARNGQLDPIRCTVFNEDLLYLFYGGVFYRPSVGTTRNASEMPVAFVFDPSLLTTILRLYPFDTGGLANGKFGNWGTVLSDFRDTFRVVGDGDFKVASRLVQHLFGSNEHYLSGKADAKCMSLPNPIPKLYEFYSDDLTQFGADHRQCIIECQMATAVAITRTLLWVGFPESMTDDFVTLCQWIQPYIPQFYSYASHVIKNPAQIAAQLETVAHEQVIARYGRLP